MPQCWRDPWACLWVFLGVLPAVPAQLALSLAPDVQRTLCPALRASVSPFRAWCSVHSDLRDLLGGPNEVTHVQGLLHSPGPITSDVSLSCFLFRGAPLPTSPTDKPQNIPSRPRSPEEGGRRLLEGMLLDNMGRGTNKERGCPGALGGQDPGAILVPSISFSVHRKRGDAVHVGGLWGLG